MQIIIDFFCNENDSTDNKHKKRKNYKTCFILLAKMLKRVKIGIIHM